MDCAAEQEKGGYVTHHERLLSSIARQLWPLLGVSAPVADALWAWVHFREVRFAVLTTLPTSAKTHHQQQVQGFADTLPHVVPSVNDVETVQHH